MIRTWTGWAACSLSLLVAAPTALGQLGDEPRQPNARQPGQQQQQGQKEHEKMLSELDLAECTKLLNKEVSDQQGQAIGTIKDVVIDPTHDKATFIVVEMKQQANQARPGQPAQPGQAQANQNGKLKAIPFQALQTKEQAGQHKLTINVAKDRLEQLEGFSQTDMPEFDDKTYVQKQYQALGLRPYWQDAQRRPGAQPGAQANAQAGEEIVAIKASEMKGDQIKNDEGQMLGKTHDVLIDMEEGRLAYLVLAIEKNGQQQPGARPGAEPARPGQPQAGQIRANGQQQLSLVPWAAVNYEKEQESLSLDADQQTLQRTAFSESDWPDLSNEQVARNLHQQFGEEPYWEVFGYPRYEEEGQRPGTPRNGATPRPEPRDPILQER